MNDASLLRFATNILLSPTEIRASTFCQFKKNRNESRVLYSLVRVFAGVASGDKKGGKLRYVCGA